MTTRPPPSQGDTCPCGGGAYARCCGRFHPAGSPGAPDAEALMRSRYSAFALGLADYLLATWHPSTRPASIEPLPPGAQFVRLDVRECLPGPGPDAAEVEFVAVSKHQGRAHRLHERSRFVREGGRWYYLDGEMR